MIRTITARLVFGVAIFTPAIVSIAWGQEARPAQAAKAPAEMTIPKDATANPNGTWSYTDKQGKHWIYRQSPMGVSRFAAEDTANTAIPAGVPKDAVPNANGTYTATDKTGKKWIYSSTPFGFSRAPAIPDWKVTDKGDSVRFERAAMMGAPIVWEKKKTELTDEERTVWQASQTKRQTARPE